MDYVLQTSKRRLLMLYTVSVSIRYPPFLKHWDNFHKKAISSTSSNSYSYLSMNQIWVTSVRVCFYTVSQKNCANLFFCQNFSKFTPIVKIFGTMIAEKTSFSAVYSFSTSPNLCQHTTVLNCSKFYNDLISIQ